MERLLGTLVAALIGGLFGPRITWAIRSWPGHEALDPRYLNCPDCQGGIRRGCCNAGRWQDRIFLLSSALLAGGSFWFFGFGTKALFSWVFGISCLIITVVDYRFLIIPDTLSINGYYLGLAWNGLIALWVVYGNGVAPEMSIPFTESLLGFLVGGGFLWALRQGAWLILKKEGMGGGDIKLLAAMGAWVGWKPVVGTIILASFMGTLGGLGQIVSQWILYRKKYRPFSHMIPFGPYLCVGFLIIFFAGMEPLYWLMEQYQLWVDGMLSRGH